jgi:DNA (cytosine-5)-methyltransferase 1
LFAGAGGASVGIEAALGRAVDVAINHNPAAVAMHQANHPHTAHLRSDVWEVDPVEATGGRPVSLLWASPDCRHFSRAKGAKPVSKKIRSLAWVVVKWAAKVKPALICLENVREFQDWGPLVHLKIDGVPQFDRDGKPVMFPCKDRKGQTFKRFTRELHKLGYRVEWRILDAADTGAPTHRRRLFLVSRRDQQPVVWPEPTHGPGRAHPWRTAAECIDWSLPCPSIFGRKRPLAEKTMRRIAMGIGRYVLNNPKPFIVNLTHGGRVESVDEPARTITGANRGEKALVAATMVQTGYGERAGQSPRALDIDAPHGTVVAGGAKSALVAAMLAKHYGGVVGHGVDRPVGTVTAVDHHSLVTGTLVEVQNGSNDAGSRDVNRPAHTVTANPKGGGVALAAASMISMRRGQKQWNGADDPLPTITAGSTHAGLVYAFLASYYGQGVGQELGVPMRTATTKDRFGLVTVEIGPGELGVVVDVPGKGPHVIVDIGLRMLTPRELARCQGFDDSYILTGTKTEQVARIGNSVCPPVAEAIVRANTTGGVA